MEAAGLAMAVVTLSGLFTTCMECFEYVRLGSEFGQDYEKCILRLDVCKVQLSRWGWSIGLSGAPTVGLGLNPTQQEISTAEKLLNSIAESFAKVQIASEAYEQRIKTSTNQIPPCEKVVEGATKRLHTSLCERAATRQAKTSTLKKISWAVYEKRKFDSMVADITASVRALIDLFPETKPSLERLARSEVPFLGSAADLQLLLQVMNGDDPLLEKAIVEAFGRQGSLYNNIEAIEDSRIHAGDIIENSTGGHGHVYTGVRTSGRAVAHFGNRYSGGA